MAGLTGRHFVAKVLEPLRLVVWGTDALRYLGVPTTVDYHTISVNDDEILAASQKLSDAGFIQQDWSFGFYRDPATFPKLNPLLREEIEAEYANFDAISLRFDAPEKTKYVQRTVLVPASYIRLAVPQPASFNFDDGGTSTSQPPFHVHNNLYYPNVMLLLQSIIRVILNEQELCSRGSWVDTLAGWAHGYLYWELSLRDDILDGCQDVDVKDYFLQNIKCKPGTSRVREKWNKPKPLNTSSRIKDFQIRGEEYE